MGVEIGQVAFVAVILGLWWTMRSLTIPMWLQYAPGYLVGAVGAFWTIDRIAALMVS
ncbi:MAG: hypothetical protein ACO3RT_02075 [Arenicellales bacterium]